jgi:hypothetical protein
MSSSDSAIGLSSDNTILTHGPLGSSLISTSVAPVFLAGTAEAANDLGTLLKFAKGIWTLGDHKAPADAEFIACPEAVVIGWIRFDTQRVAERILKRPGDKRRLPDRDELSMPEKSQWPLDSKGAPKDPWVRQTYLPMIDGNGALVTFVSGSVGGKLAVGKLCSAYLNNRARPIITLDVGSFRSKEYGNIPAPDFRIVGFERGAEAEEAPADFRDDGDPGPSLDGPLDDEMPF